jgi:four helix bundle protein
VEARKARQALPKGARRATSCKAKIRAGDVMHSKCSKSLGEEIMAGVGRFEDLKAWQQARELTREIYKATRSGPAVRDFSFVNQIRSAASSVMSNIAEGFERNSLAEFHQFLVIAKGSCGEVRSNTYMALDVGYLSDSECRRLGALAESTGKIIGALRSAVQKRRDRKKNDRGRDGC